MKYKVKNIDSKDYESICELGTNVYPSNYYEDYESFISKIKNSYHGCLCAELDGIIGYIISFPYFIGKSFPINEKYQIQDNFNCWYIHDICVAKDFRHFGIAKELVNSILNNKQKAFCLTSVLNSEKFWNQFGFKTFFTLKYCGAKANYMMLIKD